MKVHEYTDTQWRIRFLGFAVVSVYSGFAATVATGDTAYDRMGLAMACVAVLVLLVDWLRAHIRWQS